MKKKNLLILMVISFCIALFGMVSVSASSNGTCGDDLTWMLDSDGTLTISGSGKMSDYSENSYGPWYNNRGNIKKIIIRNGVTSIGDFAFSGCTSFTSITIPNSVTTIGDYAFHSNYSLESITIPNSVKSIGDCAFIYSSLKSITIPSSVENIGDLMLLTCLEEINVAIDNQNYSSEDGVLFNKEKTELILYPSGKKSKTYVVPDTVTRIETDAIWGCDSIESITLPSSIESIVKNVFANCTNLAEINVAIENQNYSSKDGVLFNKEKVELIRYPAGKKNSTYEISDDVTSIGDSAFSHCLNLESITIPNSVTIIDSTAFDHCTGLTDVYYKGTKEEWDEIIINSGNSLLLNATLHFFESTEPDPIIPVSNVQLSKNTIELKIGDTESLLATIYPIDATNQNVVWTSSDENIATVVNGTVFAIAEGNTIISVISEDGGYIDTCYVCVYEANFTYEVSNEEVTITGLIGSAEKLIIPSSIDGYPVTSIGDWAFKYCNTLTNVIIGDGVTSIGKEAFCYCSGLTSIIIPDSVTSVGEGAFYCCTGLTGITIGNCVESIGKNAFYYCSGLTSITIPDSVTNIGNSAFNGCTGLTDIIIGNSVENIGEGAFFCCSSITSITIPDSVTNIGKHAFAGCTGLTDIIIGNSVENIGEEAFYDCIGLTNITIPDSVISIGNSAFSSCTGLTGITIGNNVESIGKGAFYHCIGLKNVNIPNSVTNIGFSAFNGCRGLISITIPSSITSIGEWAFYDCISLKSIIIPNSVTSIGEGAFSGCMNLNIVIYYGKETEWGNIIIGSDNDVLTNKVVFVSTKTTISDNGKTFTVNPFNVEEQNTIILALYDGDRFVEMQFDTYKGEIISFKTTVNYTSAKVMVWESMKNLKPVCDVEIVK